MDTLGRLLHIGVLIFLAAAFSIATYMLYNLYKRKIVNGKSLLDEPINENKRPDRMGIGEILVYVLMFVIAILFVVSILYKGTRFPSVTAVVLRSILLVPIMAFVNARKRTGKAVVAVFASLLFVQFSFFAYMLIGLPVKAPVLTINDTKIILGQTTVKELLDNGFDIYTEKELTTWDDYQEFSHSEKFERYSDTMEISIPKGYHLRSTEFIPHATGILVKEDVMIAEVKFYGSLTKDMPLKDCSIILFDIAEFIPKPDKDKVSVELNGIDLLSGLETDEMKKTFAKKFLGSKILREDRIESDKNYHISWSSSNDHLFFNSYVASIDMDDDHFMKTIRLTCEIARERDR